MTRRYRPLLITAIALVALLSGSRGDARINLPLQNTPPAFARPTVEHPSTALEVHKINKMGLTVTNNGFFGSGYFRYRPVDPETGRLAKSCEYPINSDLEYLWTAALWFGAVVGRDTLVSIGAGMYYWNKELWPDNGEKGKIIRRSSLPFSIHHSDSAVSEEDIIAYYTDTLTNPSFVREDPIDNRPHQPLHLEVKQSSYAWSYPYAEDFILLDFEIKNIGRFPLRQLYIGLVVEAIVFHESKSDADETWRDDICGFKRVVPSPIWPGELDTVNVAWVADNDGDPVGRFYDNTSPTSVTATRVIRTPSDSLEYSFNWWVTHFNTFVDWGPRQVTEDKPFRDFGSLMGSTPGDHNKYYILSTREFDYDQLECAVSHTSEGWLPPPPPDEAVDYADGENPIYLLSFGPFDVEVGQTLPVTLAYIAGENFHHDPEAFDNLFDPYNPSPYIDQLDFSDLGLNSKWAEWIYDNPGYDTDNDGDSGLAKWFFNADSSDSSYEFYKGDGVPDFRGAAPPPAPEIEVIPGYGRLTLRWNGEVTETFVDNFSGYRDFEGYKVYYGEDNRSTDFVLLASYDKRDYNRFRWNNQFKRWDVSEVPIDYDSLVKIYGPGFEPDLYTIDSPLEPSDSRNPDNVYTYFTPQYWNDCNLSDPHGIHKVYPDADLTDSSDTTADGYHRFYEYEYVIENLPPARPVYVSVTAFDYGSRVHKLSSLESSLLINTRHAYAFTGAEEVEEKGLGVIVYPNPYRVDGGYARAGYENRDRTKSAERARAIHFANLPKVCTIRIFTVDGDLVEQIDHNRPDGGPDAQVATWNMLSRNTQAITTGIYIWSVTSDMGEQLGKLVIIK